MRFCARVLLLSLLFLPATSSLHAFGNNNVRVDDFKWMHVQTEHFDIYFDEENRFLVPRVAHYLEKAWREVGDIYNFHVPVRTPFFLYADHNKFEQTNIVPIGEGTGGVTEAFKNRFLVFNDGSEEWLSHVIPHEFTHVVQFNILYGGWWKSVRLLKSPFYPLWMMEGMSEYGSGDIDEGTSEMVIRDAVANGILPSLTILQGFGHLKPNQITLGYKTGEAAIQFLADEYGEERPADLLFKMKDHFDISSGLEELLGVDLDRFDFRFQEWEREKYARVLRDMQPPAAYGPRLTTPDPIPTFNEAPVISPDGSRAFFFSDRGGPTQLYEMDLPSGKPRPILGLKWGAYENVQTRGRALSLSPDGRYLAFAGEKRQKDFLYFFDLERKRLKRVKPPFDELRTPVFSPSGEELVCVGMEGGFNDLYRIDRRGRVLERLTNNAQDERDPVYSLDGTRLYFSGETVTPDGMAPAYRNLYAMDLKTKQVTELTSYRYSETEPEPLPDGSIAYVRETGDNESRAYNIHRLAPDGTDTAWTNVSGGAFTPRYVAATNTFYYVAFHAGEKHLYQASWTFTAPPVAAASETPLPEAPRRPAPRLSLLTGPAGADSPLFMDAPKPYRFKASTDLFLPFFLYSTQDGLVFMDIWQVSDMLGNHQIQQQMQYASGSDFYDVAVFYTYARFRPQFTIGGRTVQYYRDFDEQNQRREKTAIGLMSYPLDRVSSAVIGVGATDREDRFLDDDSEDDENQQDRYWIAGLQYDTITGRYLVPTKGRRVDIFFQQGVSSFGGREQYKSGIVEAAQYFPLPRESVVATRLFYGRSVGENAQVYRLGGVDRIRAVTSNSLENKKYNAVIGSMEMRMRIKYLNARTKFLFPDFFFKAAYLIVFDDMGYGWDNAEERNAFTTSDLENSAGVGISWPTFILQSFQMNITVQWAHQTNSGSDVWYITLGPTF